MSTYKSIGFCSLPSLLPKIAVQYDFLYWNIVPEKAVQYHSSPSQQRCTEQVHKPH